MLRKKKLMSIKVFCLLVIFSCIGASVSFADLAERMPLSDISLRSGDKPGPGDVVIIDKGGFVRKSDRAHSPLVIGVVSTKPAHVLRNMIQESVPVALSGIVPCKVTNENGRIRPGDLLVSSSTDGFAMKASRTAPPGTVIGKALDKQEAARDSVLMLVMNR